MISALYYNNRQHNANLNFLREAERCLQHNQPARAASLLRTFARAEQLRRAERARLSEKASPYESAQIALKLKLEKLILERMVKAA